LTQFCGREHDRDPPLSRRTEVAVPPGNVQQLVHRTAIIEGHVRAVKRLFEEDRPTLEILTQLRAVRASLNRLQHVLFEEHVEALLLDLETPEQRAAAVADIRAAMETLP
jgi:DNA-binding FrmR family transcriptional regulator